MMEKTEKTDGIIIFLLKKECEELVDGQCSRDTRHEFLSSLSILASPP